ncbi:MAG: hypothetical protein ETSY1_25755 [Candidatus Entotheonella factor]|uniref:Uncharacterized protein n=1 Tax=Entotheonella factor TaxID=1429438 RepID=W4LEX9_ENTF1|nr:MAG: hypothetical protein ETSY1_25755 [Candidatus Entotheonella factor]
MPFQESDGDQTFRFAVYPFAFGTGAIESLSPERFRLDFEANTTDLSQTQQ